MEAIINNSINTPAMGFGAFSHNDLVRACSESPHHPAWEEFYKRYDYYITLYVKKAWKNRTMDYEKDLGHSQDQLRDLCQDVYLKLIESDQQALKNFRGIEENSFLAYLARIAVNIVAEYFRKQTAEKRKGRLLSVDRLLEGSFCEQTFSRSIIFTYLSCSPEVDFLAEITVQELSKLLDQLLTGPNRERDKLIFQLHSIEGLSTQQIARVEGFSLKVSSVESIIRRTRGRLKRALVRRGF